MSISIKLLEDFSNYSDSLLWSKKAILDSKIFYLETTGFLGSLKTLGGNMFEFPIVELKKTLYCSINESNIIVFSTIRNNLKHFSIIADTINWNEGFYKNMEDVKYAKRFYSEILKIFKNTGEDYFFLRGLELIFSIQGGNNFKSIGGYDYKDLGTCPDIKTINDLIKKLRLLIKFKSLEYVSERSKVKEERIRAIMNIKTDIDLKDIDNLVKLCCKPIVGKGK
jgi:hypothetical protein